MNDNPEQLCDSNVNTERPRREGKRTLDDFIFCSKMKIDAKCEKSPAVISIAHETMVTRAIPRSLKIFMVGELRVGVGCVGG